MKFASGCLVGLVLGIVISALAVVGFFVIQPADLTPFSPGLNTGNAEITITISEQYLSDQIRKRLASRQINSRDVTVSLRPPNRAEVTMAADISLFGQSITVQPRALFHFGLSNGLVSLNLDQVDVSGFAVPQDVVNQQMGEIKQDAENELNAEIKRGLANTGLHVSGIEATQGALIIKLSR